MVRRNQFWVYLASTVKLSPNIVRRIDVPCKNVLHQLDGHRVVSRKNQLRRKRFFCENFRMALKIQNKFPVCAPCQTES